jgi:hypothetical protein
MQIDAAAHNAAGDMPAMHYRRTSGQLMQRPASLPMQNDQQAQIAERRCCVGRKTLGDGFAITRRVHVTARKIPGE